ncbi:hypothetical protein R2G56_05015 [Nitratireductor aquimarinus]|uniref:Secreted protein n=1 Tax=Nitratireductor aquimarinus TaxID=889300 RepID=A0ABU4AHB7_9HYPH|nr:hypothetical protein [Nitratireductor aquimarinus]MDV6225640.1 hypothetical protein [Nitratireductor aquimarinus]
MSTGWAERAFIFKVFFLFCSPPRLDLPNQSKAREIKRNLCVAYALGAFSGKAGPGAAYVSVFSTGPYARYWLRRAVDPLGVMPLAPSRGGGFYRSSCPVFLEIYAIT